MDKKQLRITYTFLRRCAFVFISLPLLCFFLFWIKWYFAVIACLALAACLLTAEENNILKKLFKKEAKTGTAEKSIVISKTAFAEVVLVSLVYLILCGIGRLWAQSTDYMWRNAIFRDLIVRDWPVYYDKFKGALSYYIGMWLPAAAPAKLVYLICGDSEIAFTAGNLLLLVYFTAGLSILFLLLFMYFQTANSKQVFLVVIGLIFFSGMDVLGLNFVPGYYHLEWWSHYFQYSSLTTCMCWVFNQTLVPWICTVLLLLEEDISNYVFIGMACLFTGPFPFIGLFVYCIANGIVRGVKMIRSKETGRFVKETASISNICAALIIFPIIGSYLLSNTLMGQQSVETGVNSGIASWETVKLIMYLRFVIIEFGALAGLIAKRNKKNVLFYVTVLQLLVYPFFNLGVNSDFTMRASIPAIFMLYVLCYKYLLTEKVKIPATSETEAENPKKNKNVTNVNVFYVIVVIFLVIGAATPCVEFYRGFYQVWLRGINDPATDNYVTLNHEANPVDPDSSWPPTNFVSVDYDNTPFFKYIARKQEK